MENAVLLPYFKKKKKNAVLAWTVRGDRRELRDGRTPHGFLLCSSPTAHCSSVLPDQHRRTFPFPSLTPVLTQLTLLF
jgi:hypothetical protein